MFENFAGTLPHRGLTLVLAQRWSTDGVAVRVILGIKHPVIQKQSTS